MESLIQQRDMYKQLAAEREIKISQLGGTTRSAEEVKSELERRDEEKKKLEKDMEMYANFCRNRARLCPGAVRLSLPAREGNAPTWLFFCGLLDCVMAAAPFSRLIPEPAYIPCAWEESVLTCIPLLRPCSMQTTHKETCRLYDDQIGDLRKVGGACMCSKSHDFLRGRVQLVWLVASLCNAGHGLSTWKS